MTFFAPRTLCQALLVAVFTAYLYACPHSKVEESFQLQATHDMYYYGVRPAFASLFSDNNRIRGTSAALAAAAGSAPYDHLQYPGVVPRTFVGPLLLAAMCHACRLVLLPWGWDLSHHPWLLQLLARFLLLTLHAHAWFRMARAVDVRLQNYPPRQRTSSSPTTAPTRMGNYLLLISACQFHVPFYASRMLPNVFATVVCLHVYSDWLRAPVQPSSVGPHAAIRKAAIGLVTATGVFRCDLILLLLTVGLSWLWQRQLTVRQALRIGVATGIVILCVTVPIDSLLWQQVTLVWPEGQVFYYNTLLNKSSDWGVSAWHWYWTSALPKAMLLTALLVPLSILRLPEKLDYWERHLRFPPTTPSEVAISWLDQSWAPFLWPAFGFVALYSGLGHKEMRFLFPVLPLLNLAAAIGMDRLHKAALPRKDKPATKTARLAYWGGMAAVAVTLVGSVAFTAVSQSNYPGGEALERLARHVGLSHVEYGTVRVHIDVASAMTGVSLFGQRAASQSTPGVEWIFDKSGYEEENNKVSNSSTYTHMLSESKVPLPGFHTIDAARGQPRLCLREFRIETHDTIFVFEKEGWSTV